MTLKPLSPEVWEQALVNGRIVHPSDNSAAFSWAMDWYIKQGGDFENVTLQQPSQVRDTPAAEPHEPEHKAVKMRHPRKRAHKVVEAPMAEVPAPVVEEPEQPAVEPSAAE